MKVVSNCLKSNIVYIYFVSFMATSKAAEQWRKSWRDRQYAEAGPAENVSRGQASVPMPLTPIHQSLARMRAIQKYDKKQQGKRTVNFGTWIIIFLMICLIIGLGASIFLSYIPNSPFGVTSVTTPTQMPRPTLVLVRAAYPYNGQQRHLQIII